MNYTGASNNTPESDLKIRLPASEVAKRLGRKWHEQCPGRNWWTFHRNGRVLILYWNGRGVWLSRKSSLKKQASVAVPV